MDVDPLIAAYHRFDPHRIDDETLLVTDVHEGPFSRIVASIDGSERFQKFFLSGQAGCGKSFLMRRLAADDRLRKRQQIVAFSVADVLNIMDVEAGDLLWAVYLKLLEAMAEAGMEPSFSEIDSWLDSFAKAFDIRKNGWELVRSITSRSQIDTKCRTGFRQFLQTDIRETAARVSSACDRLSRITEGCYKLTDQSFDRLIQEDVSDTVLSRIEDLKGISFGSELKFVRAFQERIGEIQAIHYRSILLRSAWVEESRETLILVDDIDKLPPGALHRIFQDGGGILSELRTRMVMTHPLFADLSEEKFRREAGVGRIRVPAAAVRGPSGNIDDIILDRLSRVMRLRATEEVIPEEVCDFLSVHSGGVLRDLMSLTQDAFKTAIDRKAGGVCLDMARESVDQACRHTARLFDDRTYGEALASVKRTHMIGSIPEPQRAYLLRYSFALQYGETEEETWYDAHPLMDGTLNFGASHE